MTTPINPVAPKRKVGRPTGSKAERAMLKKFEEIYEKIKVIFNDEQKDYYQKVFSGRAKFDPVKMGEIFMLHFSLYNAIALDEAIEGKRFSQDIAQTIAQYRMGLKDVEEMQRKREESDAKKEADGRLVDPTRQSSESRLDKLIERATSQTTG